MKRIIFLTAIGLAALDGTAFALQDSEEDVLKGRALYDASCVRCHGIEGTGGDGPSLTATVLRRAPDGEALEEVIRSGIRGTDMPGTRWLNVHEVRQIATYVRSLGTIETAPLAGDPASGLALFEGEARCDTCHIVGGKGASLGPDLTRVGDRRGAEYLKQHVKDPSSAVPEAFLMVRVTTSDGKVIDGMRVNEDAFTIQLRDEQNQFHSFRKSSVELVKQPDRTFMPRYRSLFSDSEIDDLVAYLAGLRGSE